MMGRVFCVSLVFLVFSSVLTGQAGPWETRAIWSLPEAGRIDKPAFDRTAGFDVKHYRLELNFPFESSHFSGSVTMDIAVNEALHRLDLHMGALDIDQILMEGAACAWLHEGEDLIVYLSRSVSANTSLRLQIDYHGAPDERGFYFYDRCAYTMSEPNDARYWFPCHDVPWDKATAELIVTVPHGVEAASIGLLQSRRVSLDGTRETFHWKSRHPAATYLFCVTLSDEYVRWSDWYVNAEGDSIEMPYYVFREDATIALEDVRNMVAAMTFFSDRFGPYPFDKYGTAAVTPFKYGGMEHQSMTTVNKTWFRGNRRYEGGFVHELAHMWWGDAVTLNDWPAIWLNEGFATYSQVLFFEHFYGPDLMISEAKGLQAAYKDQAVQRDHPIYNPPMDQLFNWGISYAKGACVLHMLRRVVGEEIFWDILRVYYKTYCYGTASIPEFQAVCERLSGRPLDWFFSQWIYGSGYIRLNYNGSYENNGHAPALNLSVQQTQDQPPFRMPIPLRIETAGGVTDTSVWLHAREQRIRIAAPDSVTGIVFDPDGWVILDAQHVPGFSVATSGEPVVTLAAAPNPFNVSTRFRFSLSPDLPEWTVRFRIVNMLGQTVRVMNRGSMRPGEHALFWDGRDDSGRPAPCGIYVAELQSIDSRARAKVIKLR